VAGGNTREKVRGKGLPNRWRLRRGMPRNESTLQEY
jgi:hypothetical protein